MKMVIWQGPPPTEVEGGDAMRQEVVSDDSGDQDVPTQGPVEERAGDAEVRAQEGGDTREILIKKDDGGTAVD